MKISDPSHWRSGHQVTSSDLTCRKNLNARHSCTHWPITNFQRWISVTVSIKYLYHNFDIGDPRSGQFCDLSILNQWEKIERRLFWAKTILNTFKHRFTSRLDTQNRNIATSDPLSCRQGRSTRWSWKVMSDSVETRSWLSRCQQGKHDAGKMNVVSLIESYYRKRFS